MFFSLTIEDITKADFMEYNEIQPCYWLEMTLFVIDWPHQISTGLHTFLLFHRLNYNFKPFVFVILGQLKVCKNEIE